MAKGIRFHAPRIGDIDPLDPQWAEVAIGRAKETNKKKERDVDEQRETRLVLRQTESEDCC